MKKTNNMAYISFFIFFIYFVFLFKNNLFTFSSIIVLFLVIISLFSEICLVFFKKHTKEYAFIPWIPFLIGVIFYANSCIRIENILFINVFLVVLLIALTSILFCNLVLPQKYHLKLKKS